MATEICWALRVLEKPIAVAYRLELPPAMNKAYDVFKDDISRKYVIQTSKKHLHLIVDAHGEVKQNIRGSYDHRLLICYCQFLVQYKDDQY